MCMKRITMYFACKAENLEAHVFLFFVSLQTVIDCASMIFQSNGVETSKGLKMMTATFA